MAQLNMEDEAIGAATYGSALKTLSCLRRECEDSVACERLDVLQKQLRERDLNAALRETDRIWRHVDPLLLCAYAAIYGRLLALEARDHTATLAMLHRALQAGPDPDVSALIAWTFARQGDQLGARRQIKNALTEFCVLPGTLLSRIARAITSSEPVFQQFPRSFNIDGRVQTSKQNIHGWARIGWRPDQPPRVRVTHADGRSQIAKTATHPRSGARWPFELKQHANGNRDERYDVCVELPDGSWQPLPDSPLIRVKKSRDARRCIRPGSRPPRRKGRAAPMRAVDIIIPIYRHKEQTLACIDSVLRTAIQTVSGGAARLILVDDATPETELARALDDLTADKSITLLRNELNQGFVRSVNRALTLDDSHDVLILNSDTVVFGDWLTRMQAAAYSADRVGTVTPFSNNGTVASYPDPAGSELSVEKAGELHELAWRSFPGTRVAIPVGVGFCLYIRRDCLGEIGILDEATFGRGYGEETDLCLRARGRGWSHLLAADVFVYHAGGSSFGAARNALLERSQRILNQRYPGYDDLIADFLRTNPMDRLRRTLDERRLLAAAIPTVLLVTLALTGGVDRFVTERCAALRSEGLQPLLLRPVAAGDDSCCEISDGTEGHYFNLRYKIPAEIPALRKLLQSLSLRQVEIQHFLDLDSRVMEMVLGLSVPYDVVIHDYSWICPRVTLIDGSGRYCGEPAVRVCEHCVRRNGTVLQEEISVAQLRARSRRWLQRAREVSAPSADTARRIATHLRRQDISVKPHSVATIQHLRAGSRLANRATRRVVLIGAIGVHKGFDLLLNCARDAARRALPLEFVVVGYTHDDERLLATGRVFITGRYQEAEARHLLEREDADVAWLASVWPESWCYTLDHALEAGFPIVGFDIGAIAERLAGRAGASVLPLSTHPRQINDHLLAVASHQEEPGMDVGKREARVANDDSALEETPSEPRSDLTAAVQVLPLPSGLYLFSVKAAKPSVAAATGHLSLPAVQVGLGPGAPTDAVEFVTGPNTHGGWLFAKGDLLVVKVKGDGATLILTSVRAPDGAALALKVERLEARTGEAPAQQSVKGGPAPPPIAPVPDGEIVPLNVGAHIRTRGDMLFEGTRWAGRIGPGLWIESFSIKPLGRFGAQDIEYKALTGSGFETPWLSDEKMCGTKGMSTPLLGFAIRLKPSSDAAAYDCEYTGYFQSGHTVGPLRNGVPCRSSVASDPLEGLQVRLIKRSASMQPGTPLLVERKSPAAAAAKRSRPRGAPKGGPASRQNRRGSAQRT